MLRSRIGEGGPLKTFGYLIAVEVESTAPSQEFIQMKLVDSLGFVEGVGKVEAEPLGEIPVYEEQRMGDAVV